MILLDTNAVIALLKDTPPAVRTHLRLAMTANRPVGVSSIVLYELSYGVAKSLRRAENERRLQVFLSGGVELVPFDDSDAQAAGDIRATLEAAGTPISPYDVLIAGQARARAAMLVTTNAREFERVPD